MQNKPTLFIGSSGKAREIVKLFSSVLADAATCIPWFAAEEFKSRGTNTTISALTEAAFDYDFALFVITPDDDLKQQRREITEGVAPRDNVVFEIGLFMGSLGSNRVFLAKQECQGLIMPSDLFGATAPEFGFSPDDKQASRASIADVAQGFEDQIKNLGFNQFSLHIADGWGPETNPDRFEVNLSFASLNEHRRFLRKRKLGIGVRLKDPYTNIESDENMVFSEPRSFPQEHQDMLFKVECNQLPNPPTTEDRFQAKLLSVPANVELTDCSCLADAQSKGCRIVESYGCKTPVNDGS